MALKRKNEEEASTARKGFWNQGLKASMQDPEQIVESDDRIVIIRDKYPKAKYHFLVLPKASIPNLKSVTKDHLDLLKYMHEKGVDLAKRTDPKAKFRFGYHAVPSMSHLHLHVISQDFTGSGLKHKKHWNSFTTEFFIDSSYILKEIETKGQLQLLNPKEAEQLLKEPLRCHECKSEFPTMPKLKAHILNHC